MKFTCEILLLLFTSFCDSFSQNKEPFQPFERVYLHTDRNVYLAGENLFYALYLQGNSNQMSKYAYLLLRDSHNGTITSARLEIVNRIAYGNLFLADTLTSGVYQIVCFTNWMRNEGEESFFTKEILIANRFDQELNTFKNATNAPLLAPSAIKPSGFDSGNGKLAIHLEKQIYLPREKITFSVESKEIPENSVLKLSISISEMVPELTVEPSISDYFNKMKMAIPAGDRPIQWSYYPEVEGPVLQGKVMHVWQSDTTSSTNNRVIENGQTTFKVMVSTPDSNANMQFTTTDSTGSFALMLNRFYDGKELIIRVKEHVIATIEADNPFLLITHFKPSGYFNVYGLNNYLLRCEKIAHVNRTYSNAEPIFTVKEFLPAKTIPRIYYKPYYVVHPSDFMELPDFIEISRELIPAFKVRKERSHYISNYINLQDQSYFNEEPAIFLDGVPIDDVNEIISLGSARINRIETLPVTRFYQDMSFPGILAVFTKNQFINGIQFNTPAIRYLAQWSRPFTIPKLYEPKSNDLHIPDIRQLLLWEPDVEIKKNEKREIVFYASDLRGNFSINIQGITAEGDPVSASAIITIQAR